MFLKNRQNIFFKSLILLLLMSSFLLANIGEMVFKNSAVKGTIFNSYAVKEVNIWSIFGVSENRTCSLLISKNSSEVKIISNCASHTVSKTVPTLTFWSIFFMFSLISMLGLLLVHHEFED